MRVSGAISGPAIGVTADMSDVASSASVNIATCPSAADGGHSPTGRST